MNNGIKPIYPSKNNTGGLLSEDDENYLRVTKKLTGLSKLEFFTAFAMQGLAANPNLLNNSPEFIAELSAKIADKTLKQTENFK